MTTGLQGSGRKTLHSLILEHGTMTKRDRQMSEYAAESYEKSDEIRTKATTIRDTTPSEGTVGERLVERFSITHTLLEDNEKLRAEIARLRLTAEEREAVEWYAGYGKGDHAATLRNLLERMK